MVWRTWISMKGRLRRCCKSSQTTLQNICIGTPQSAQKCFEKTLHNAHSGRELTRTRLSRHHNEHPTTPLDTLSHNCAHQSLLCTCTASSLQVPRYNGTMVTHRKLANALTHFIVHHPVPRFGERAQSSLVLPIMQC